MTRRFRGYWGLMATLVVGGLLLLGGCAGSSRTADEAEEQDVVEVGYGTQDRDKVTGAVSSVDVDEAKKQPARSVQELLRGRVAGVVVNETPGGGFSVQIRGVNTFNGSTEPLYVLDGVPMQPGPGGAINGISVHDIESIEVLKDAGSTAIYGSRGANGVIVIKTKR